MKKCLLSIQLDYVASRVHMDTRHGVAQQLDGGCHRPFPPLALALPGGRGADTALRNTPKRIAD